MSVKQSIKHQVHRTHVGAVGWERQQFYHDMHGESGSRVTSKLKQGEHIHLRTAWLLPHACVQPYHAGSGSHGQLCRRYWDSSAWHSCGSETGENPSIKNPFLPVPAPHNTCGRCWLETAQQFSHDMRGEGGSWVWCKCAPCFNLSFENSELNCSTA